MQNATFTVSGQSCVASYQQTLPCHILTHGQNSARSRIFGGKLMQSFANRADQRIREGTGEGLQMYN